MVLVRAAEPVSSTPPFYTRFPENGNAGSRPLRSHGTPLLSLSRLNLLSLLEDLMEYVGAFRLDFLGDGRDEEA